MSLHISITILVGQRLVTYEWMFNKLVSSHGYTVKHCFSRVYDSNCVVPLLNLLTHTIQAR